MEKVKILPRTIFLTIGTILFLIVFYYGRSFFLTFFIGLGLGVLIAPILNNLRYRFHFPRSLSAILVFFCILLIVGGLGAAIYYLVSDQVSTLIQQGPQHTKQLENWFSDLFNRYPEIKQQVQKFNISETIKSSFKNVFQGLKTGITILSGLIFVVVIGLFTAVNSREYFCHTVEAFPPSRRKKASEILCSSASVLRQWFTAQLLDMLVIGVMTAVGLWLVGLQYWAIIGVLTAVVGLVPYIGTLTVVVVGTLITLATNPSQVPWVLLVFLITQQVEGNLILPLIMKGKADLPEVLLLFFMIFMGTFFGLLGLIIAAPLLAVLRNLYLKLYLPKINSMA